MIELYDIVERTSVFESKGIEKTRKLVFQITISVKHSII